MTKYTSLEKKEKGKKTVFNKLLTADFVAHENVPQPELYDNVMFLFSDQVYGDVFLAWDNGNENERDICFGEKGDEF